MLGIHKLCDASIFKRRFSLSAYYEASSAVDLIIGVSKNEILSVKDIIMSNVVGSGESLEITMQDKTTIIINDAIKVKKLIRQ